MTKSIEVQKSEEVKNFFSCFQADLKYKVISVHFRILIYSVLIPNSKRLLILVVSLTGLYTLKSLILSLFFH